MATVPNMAALLSLDPGWLSTPKAQAWRRACLNQKDVTLDRLKRAIKMRFASLAPADAQAAIGYERLIDRGPSETNDAYAARLIDAWDIWRWGGTTFGILCALRDAGYPNAFTAIVNGKLDFLYPALQITPGGPGIPVVAVAGQTIPAVAMTCQLEVIAFDGLNPVCQLCEDGTPILSSTITFTLGTAFSDLGAVDSRLTGVKVAVGGAPQLLDYYRFRVGPDASGLGFVRETLPAGSWACGSTPAFWSRFVVVFPGNPWGRASVSAAAWQSGHTYAAGAYCASNSSLWYTGAGGISGASAPPAGLVGDTFVDSGGFRPIGWLCVGPSSQTTDWIRPAQGDDRITTIRRLVAHWKSAKATCADIAVINQGRTWDYPWQGRTWDGQGGLWSGNDVLHYTI